MRSALAAAALLLAGCATVQAQEQPRAQWVTLGTSGGPQVHAERSQIANALALPDGAAYLFDTGNGVQRQMAFAGIPEPAVRAVFLSHHHLDHVADLGPILWTHWTFGQGVLTVVGPVGTQELVDGLVAAAPPIMLAGYPTAGPAKPGLADMVRVIEVPADLAVPQEVWRDQSIIVEAVGVDHYQSAPSIPLDHLPQALAFRVVTPGRTIVYTGDSGPSPRLASLATGADLLVTEVVELDAIRAALAASPAPPVVREGIARGMAINHLTPAEIGRMAAAARVGEVLLTHFVPSPEIVPDRTIYTRQIGESYAGPVRIAEDLGRY